MGSRFSDVKVNSKVPLVENLQFENKAMPETTCNGPEHENMHEGLTEILMANNEATVLILAPSLSYTVTVISKLESIFEG